MFTGIVEEIGTVKTVRRGAKSVTLEIEACEVLQGTQVGDSIATNGVCLTVTSLPMTAQLSPASGKKASPSPVSSRKAHPSPVVSGNAHPSLVGGGYTHPSLVSGDSIAAPRGIFTADVMPETVCRTSLASLKPGSAVNLERALTLQTRLGGHMVSGHVDGTGTIVRREQDDNALWLWIETTPQIMRYIIEKGSIAIQGISLTVAKVEPTRFAVSLIPHTQQATTLHSAKIGDIVNLENDIIAKYVEKLMPQGNSQLNMEKAEQEKVNLYRSFLMA